MPPITLQWCSRSAVRPQTVVWNKADIRTQTTWSNICVQKSPSFSQSLTVPVDMRVSECQNWAINGLLFADPVVEVRRPTLSQSYNICGSINVHRPPALATDFPITAIFGTDNCVPVYESPVAVIRDQSLFINFVLDCTTACPSQHVWLSCASLPESLRNAGVGSVSTWAEKTF